MHARRRHRQRLGAAFQVDMLTVAFSPFGTVQNVKLVRDKGGTAGAALPARLPSSRMLAC